MALSGDIQCKPSEGNSASIRLETDIRITNSGLLSDDPCDRLLTGVTQVVSGDIDEVLHLIGHRSYDIMHLTTDGVLSSSEEVIQKLRQLGPRAPGSHLLVHDNRLYGVIVDQKNESRVVGVVDSVVPNKQTNCVDNTISVGKDGVWKTCRSRDLDLKDLIASGVVFGIVSEDGFAFFQTDTSTDTETSNLVLVLNKGYFYIEDLKVDWIRLQIGLRIDEFATKRTTILENECLVSKRVGFVRNDDRFIAYGSQNSVLDFDALQNMMKAMRTVGPRRDGQTDGSAEPLENESKSRDESKPEAKEETDSEVSQESIEGQIDPQLDSQLSSKANSKPSVDPQESDQFSSEDLEELDSFS